MSTVLPAVLSCTKQGSKIIQSQTKSYMTNQRTPESIAVVSIWIPKSFLCLPAWKRVIFYIFSNPSFNSYKFEMPKKANLTVAEIKSALTKEGISYPAKKTGSCEDLCPEPRSGWLKDKGLTTDK